MIYTFHKLRGKRAKRALREMLLLSGAPRKARPYSYRNASARDSRLAAQALGIATAGARDSAHMPANGYTY
jgi:hypothetical protein